MRKRSELFFNLLLVPLDVAGVLLSFVVAYILRVEYSLKPTVYQVPGWEYLYALVALMPFIILFFALAGLYRFESMRSRWREYLQVVIAVSASTMFLIIVDFFATKPLFPSKAVVFYGFIIAVGLVVLERFLVNLFQRWLFRFSIGVRQVVIVGMGQIADDVTYTLQRNPGFHLVRVLKLRKDTLSQLERLVKRYNIDELFIADKAPAEADQLEYIRFAHKNHIVYKFIPSLAGIYQTRSQPSLYADYPVLEIIRTPLDGWWRVYKTFFDYIGAILGIVLLSPLFIVIAIIIKLTDGGKVFYRHTRIGRHGRIIRVWKFRSMYAKYSTGGSFSGKTDLEIIREIGDEAMVREFKHHQKLKKDPRVTPIGRFIRATSIDELPQLFNVLVGELSLIGPRPVTETELERYKDKAPTFLLIKPGITGLWQVSGRNDVSYDERIKLDVYYVENWQASMDLRIILRTLGVIFKRQGY